MKTIILLLLLGTSTILVAQNPNELVGDGGFVIDTIEKPDILPTPIEGHAQFKQWIIDNNSLTGLSDTLRCNDVVVVNFLVDTMGYLSVNKLLRSIGEPYDSEAKRLVEQCPIIWSPAIKNDIKIDCPLSIAIRFNKE